YISKKVSSPNTLINLMSETGVNISGVITPIAIIHTNIKNIDSVMSHFHYGADRLHTALIQIFRMSNLPVLSINYSISSMNIILFSENSDFEKCLDNIICEYEKNCRQILSVDITASVTGIFKSLNEASDIILKMLNITSDDINSGVKNEHIKAALSYIEANYKNDLSLAEVANFVHLTTYHFSKLFKTTMGTNFVNYITALRIQKAQDMLLDTFMSVTEIGENSGFSSANNFFRVFKKITGMSPQQYRNTQVKNPRN
ncbi:MAG: helix-turn-helix transcriptional regulator, partial [Clostridia bacterium]|nr:helix-turn-helix transcriptional regulator [Clostridia bacterium]